MAYCVHFQFLNIFLFICLSPFTINCFGSIVTISERYEIDMGKKPKASECVSDSDGFDSGYSFLRFLLLNFFSFTWGPSLGCCTNVFLSRPALAEWISSQLFFSSWKKTEHLKLKMSVTLRFPCFTPINFGVPSFDWIELDGIEMDFEEKTNFYFKADVDIQHFIVENVFSFDDGYGFYVDVNHFHEISVKIDLSKAGFLRKIKLLMRSIGLVFTRWKKQFLWFQKYHQHPIFIVVPQGALFDRLILRMHRIIVFSHSLIKKHYFQRIP